ncbi:MAG: hypothetical protein JRI68_30470 [Deltaproteobacteria bacterium]|nr:hypothetical protein [Deltaproteobacteria bacterium]
MAVDRSSWCALAVSLVAHASLAVTTVALVADEAPAFAATEPAGAGELDVGWAGDTFDIDGLVPGEPGSGPAAAEARPEPPTEENEPEADGLPPEPTAQPSPPAPPPAAADLDPEPQVPPAPEPPAAPDSPPAPSPEPPSKPTPAAASPAEPAPSAQPADEGEGEKGNAAAKRGASPSEDEGSGTASAGDGKGRTYGAAGGRRGVRVLGSAFTRAIPAAVSADLSWSRLPIGRAGRLEIAVTLDDEGKITAVVLPDDAAGPLRALVDRTMALLRAGRFALSHSGGAGEETLRIEVELSQRAPIEHDSAKPTDALKLGHQAPTPTVPGKAFFTLASGRHFEAAITVVRSAGRGKAGASD